MKKSFYILSFVTLVLVFVTCQKKPQLKIHKLEITEEHVEVTPYSATITANYSYPGAVPQIKVFVSTSNSMSNALETDAVLDEHTMTATVNGLISDTKYYYRFRYSNGIKLVDTEIKDFTTEHAIVVPTLTTIPAASITSNSAVSGGNISDDGGSEITARGVCWSDSPNPTIEDNHTENGTGIGSYISNLTNLNANTVYYVKAYATNGEGTGYGNEIMFVTSAALATVSTKPVTDVTGNSAKSGGNITNSGGMEITSRGVCWSTEHNPTTNDSHTTDGPGIGEFESEITDLNAHVVYYIRAYATSAYGTAYGEERSFTTIAGMPVVTTKSVTGITASSATCGGNVINSGGESIIARGVCWATTQNPTISDSHTSDGTGTGEFASSITGLTNNVTYYVRAYATNSNGTAYGEERSFTSQDGLAVITTSDVRDITSTSAVAGGSITNNGGSNIIAKGVCYSTSQNPTLSGNHTNNGTGSGTFSTSITGLTHNTTYYVRAYATNNTGTSYGEEKVFTTDKIAPTVITNPVGNVTSNSAMCWGRVTNDGGSQVVARGFCWCTQHNPTLDNDHTTDGNGVGSFVSTITGLNSATVYYIRAYATNEMGTAYGNEVCFGTQVGVTIPIVTTTEVTNITATSATCGGDVTSDGQGTVSARGVCWSTYQNPTTSNSHTTNGTGTGTFTSSITGLTPNTTYYVRAYATNEAGTAYGTQKTFTTNTDVTTPTVTTNNVSDITTTTATCGGNVTSDGGSTVTSRGVCWSTSHNPVLNIYYMTSDGSGTGEYVSSITGLQPNTTYYVRAYASNSQGTAYGSEVSFTTQSSGSQVPTGAINGLFSVSDSQQVWFSQGNLQYQASTNTWRFADSQYDYVGSNNSYISSTYSGWIDLFGWGTSGFNHGAVCYQPWSTSQTNSDYYAYGSAICNLYDQTGMADWGYNAISNGGNFENIWHSLTKDELNYLLHSRNNANNKFSFGTVNGKRGLILLPDTWTLPAGCSFTPQATNWTTNTYTLTQWSSMEQNGAVFLPSSGSRQGVSFGMSEQRGGYWTGTSESYGEVYKLYWDGAYLYNNGVYADDDRLIGYSVRLVKNVE